MFFSSRAPTWKRTFLETFLNALMTSPSGALLTTPKLHLWTGSISWNPETPLSTFTSAEATFTGYTASAIAALTGPVASLVGTRAMLVTKEFALGSSPTVTQEVAGYWVDAGATPDWVLAETFPSPVGFFSEGDFLTLSVLLGLTLVNQVG